LLVVTSRSLESTGVSIGLKVLPSHVLAALGRAEFIMASSSIHGGLGDRTEIRPVFMLILGTNQDHSALDH